MSSAEREEIIKRIESHDYDAFIQFYNWYQINKLNNPDGWVYFPQYIDMADDDGNNCRYCILDQTDRIELLAFMGGEPLINIDGMEYFLDRCIEKSIPIRHMKFTTNGLLLNQRIIDVIVKYHNYIEDVRKVIGRGEYPEHCVSITVSVDDFHVGYNPHDKYMNFKNAFKELEHIKVMRCDGANIPLAQGRAVSIPYAIKKVHHYPTQFDYKTAEHEPPCFIGDFLELENDNQMLIICPVFVTANGVLYKQSPDMPVEYELMDSPNPYRVGSVYNNKVSDLIMEYNKDKPLCLPYSISRVNEINNKKRNPSINDEAIRLMPYAELYRAKKPLYTAEVDAVAPSYLMAEDLNVMIDRWNKYLKKHNVDIYGNEKE